MKAISNVPHTHCSASPAGSHHSGYDRYRAAEFFAGVGLVRAALGDAFDVVFANDIDPKKHALYLQNFGDAKEYVLGDIASVAGHDVPDIDLATASFPCTDLSLAGNRRGLAGKQSGLFWQFARILREMGDRAPDAVLIENVIGLATSHGGRDLESAIAALNDLGYTCDMLVADARWFVPQSRPRLFIVAYGQVPAQAESDFDVSAVRPEWMKRFISRRPHLRVAHAPIGLPPHRLSVLAEIIERLDWRSRRWWDSTRTKAFLRALSPVQKMRLEAMKRSRVLTWATAYRRTRNGRPMWEIRADTLAGCLRTTRGGSSKQAVVEAGRDIVRVRWMSAREYARLQGAPDFKFDPHKENEAMFGFGDAVCVPVVHWVVQQTLRPYLSQIAHTQHRAAR